MSKKSICSAPSGIARLASGAFYFAIQILTFYEFIKIKKGGNVP
ncbi:MAG: hypothetical protein NTY64_21665 [Deltaproteobacteria bacterium]|nr:hypothetical protein [Deltaproteobacteria bacterium]